MQISLRSYCFILFSSVMLFACSKDEQTEEITPTPTPTPTPTQPTPTPDPYKDLKTTVVFDEDFSSMTNWTFDTTLVDDSASGSYKITTAGKRVSFDNGLMDLVSYYLTPEYDTTQRRWVSQLALCIATRDLGTIVAADRYLLEIEVTSLYTNFSTHIKSGNHSDSFSSGGTELIINLNGIKYSVFGVKTYSRNYTNGTGGISNCINDFKSNLLQIILDSKKNFYDAKLGDDLIRICAAQSTSTSSQNFIQFDLHPIVSGDYGVSQPNETTAKPNRCRISHLKLSTID